MDLVWGTYTNGSDERDYANTYFDRCYYGMFPDQTFVRYLLEWEDIDAYIKDSENVQWLEKEIASYGEKSELDEEEEAVLEDIRDELKFAKEEVAEYYERYCEWCRKEEPESLEKAQAGVAQWKADYEKLQRESVFNETAEAYCKKAMLNVGISEEQVNAALNEISRLYDTVSEQEIIRAVYEQDEVQDVAVTKKKMKAI